MDFSFLNNELFYIGTYGVRTGPLVASILLVALLFFVSRMYIRTVFNKSKVLRQIDENKKDRVRKLLRNILILFAAIIILIILGIDQRIFESDLYQLRVSHFLWALILFECIQVLDWLVTNVFIHTYYQNRDAKVTPEINLEDSSEQSGTQLVKYIFYILTAIILLQLFKLDFTLLENTVNDKLIQLKISNILGAILIFIFAQLLIWFLTHLILYNFYRSRKVDLGAQFAFNQLLKYVIYIFAIILALENLGIQMTILLGGAAALLVGVGLGLQQTFNDFISGIVLLFERSVAVGDIMVVDETVGTVKKIGMRSSILETRQNVTFVVPNSKIVNDNVVNWTHFSTKVRFNVDVGVAYGTDTQLVKKLLLEVAKNNPYIINYPAPFVRFNDFGDSALMMSLFFFSRNCLIIEDIKSDLRFEIDQVFRENKIQIPFPQRDIWIKSE